jgi:ubiquinone/menaquinone biosynthesis C-methylase UbiE
LKQTKGLKIFRVGITSRLLYLRLKPKFLAQFLVGTLDFHSIFRVLAIKSAIKNVTPTVDVGAAKGDMTIELALANFSNSSAIDALVYDKNDITDFRLKLRSFNIQNINILQDDAQLLSNIKDNYAQQVLLLDVLEHVENDTLAIKAAYRVLKKGGCLIISVPTHYYPLYFGERFDRILGHKRHYFYEEIKPLLENNGFKIEEFFYYTSAVPSHYCTIIYDRLSGRGKVMDLTKAFLTPLIGMIGLEKESPSTKIDNHSSLLIVAIK